MAQKWAPKRPKIGPRPQTPDPSPHPHFFGPKRSQKGAGFGGWSRRRAPVSQNLQPTPSGRLSLITNPNQAGRRVSTVETGAYGAQFLSTRDTLHQKRPKNSSPSMKKALGSGESGFLAKNFAKNLQKLRKFANFCQRPRGPLPLAFLVPKFRKFFEIRKNFEKAEKGQKPRLTRAFGFPKRLRFGPKAQKGHPVWHFWTPKSITKMLVSLGLGPEGPKMRHWRHLIGPLEIARFQAKIRRILARVSLGFLAEGQKRPNPSTSKAEIWPKFPILANFGQKLAKFGLNFDQKLAKNDLFWPEGPKDPATG